MEKLEALPPPPGVISSLQAGFNVVSSRMVLILLPLVFDVFLWLGPRVSMGKLAGEVFQNWLKLSAQYGAPAQDLALISTNIPQITDNFTKLNILSRIWTFPIGVPILMLNLPDTLPLNTPLGVQTMIQVPSFLILSGLLIGLTVLGWIGGGLYFRLVAQASLGESDSGISLLRAWMQTALLSVIWFVSYMIAIPPLMIVLLLLGAISPVVSQVVVFVLLLFAFWLVVPLFFTPHGIFIRRQNAFVSIMNSLRMSRFTLPTSGVFVMITFLLYIGLNYLWSVPSNDSWLMLIGIAGHAFISTMLLSASFVYYRDMTNWLQVVRERLQQLPGQRLPLKKI